jgi:hypothetical protein
MTLVDYGVDMPSIDPAFSGTQTTNYWTATTTASTQMLAWTVKFDFGEVIPVLMDTKLPIRCVRGQSKTLNAGGVGLRKAGPLQSTTATVRDETTMLEWQRTDDGTKRSWKDSLSYCAGLSLGGVSGWHLPNVSELLSIVQYDAQHPGAAAIDPAFQDPKNDLYWTSTQNEGSPSLTWSVTFNLGAVDGVTVTGLGYARCVRHLGDTSGAPSVAGSGCGCELGAGAPAAPAAGAGFCLAALAVFRVRRRAKRSPESDG